MRHFLALPFLTIALSLSVPAAAQELTPESEMIEKLNDPAFQDGMASMMAGFLSAMMELPIGQFAAAANKAIPDNMKKEGGLSAIDPDATIGDLAGGDDPDFEHNMENKMRQGTAMMGIMASEFSALLPQLKEMGERMKRRMEKLD
ncbi:hypothetical protein MNBD_ALPHA04-158 [hydrothermal vent metagenome]|uniref:Uncharacterized protein n=1 Tax=hydrothermal vent metagenome TaxID=652676 RepID=A0A3B0SM90_9ZZZZ